jgi:dolichol-phosphate mannosyltransferase
MKGTSVILPTYEEAMNLPVVLPAVAAALRSPRTPFEVLVVDDSSPDGSAAVAGATAERLGLPVRVLLRHGPRSLSSAVIAGARAAKYRCLAVLDADLSHDPAVLPDLVGPVQEGEADLVIGSRYIRRGAIVEWSPLRHGLSRLGTVLCRRLSGVHDPLSGFFACRRGLLDGSELPLRPRGYKILLEILARGRGKLEVREIPIVFSDRVRGRSKLGLAQNLEFLGQVAGLWYATSVQPRMRAPAKV